MPKGPYTNLTVRIEDYEKVKGFFERNKRKLREMGLGSISDLVMTATFEKMKRIQGQLTPSVVIHIGADEEKGMDFSLYDDKVDQQTAASIDPDSKPVLIRIQDGKLSCMNDDKEDCIHLRAALSSSYVRKSLEKIKGMVEQSDSE